MAKVALTCSFDYVWVVSITTTFARNQNYSRLLFWAGLGLSRHFQKTFREFGFGEVLAPSSIMHLIIKNASFWSKTVDK